MRQNIKAIQYPVDVDFRFPASARPRDAPAAPRSARARKKDASTHRAAQLRRGARFRAPSGEKRSKNSPFWPYSSTRFRTRIGAKRAIFRPFFAAGGAKTRSAPQLRSVAGGDVLLACPGPNAGRRGRHGGARGRKNENPHFWAASVPLYHE